MSADYPFPLAPRMGALSPSPFHILQQAAKESENRGRKLLYLSVGEPGFHTPENVKEAAIRAIRNNQTRYTAADGTPELKAAICAKLLRQNNLIYAPDQVIVTMGGVQAIFNLLLATVGHGDEVLLPAPFFSPYLSSIQLTGAKPVLLPTRESEGFVPQARDVATALTNRSRWLVLNSPSNPAGAIIDRDQLHEIADVVRKHPGLMVLSDDMYEAIRFEGGDFLNIVNVAPDLAERTVVLNGVSKTYAMTGWRMAYLAGPKRLIAAVTQVSLSSAFSPNSISQAAAVEALEGPQTAIEVQLSEYRARRDTVIAALKEIPGLSFVPPRGAYFLFVNCKSYLGMRNAEGEFIRDDLDFVLYVLRKTDVALMPGSGFGMPGYLRISFATSDEVLRIATRRLSDVCNELRLAAAP
ncbi:pyridoxal phosphate-dependent aminotransferase [Bradyrhizobium sp. Ai1a-2]|uniref:pyridoxal phosphate-dependent aminotransferase n=1 Tax=Bradyrhizobium sp. Ai1a-2 TaxID=196490 RepID=UPI000408CDF5|nr:pyridoxal phosphate-dependent aminotransferase [Bradyrhizobium sp. Ai1a-2]